MSVPGMIIPVAVFTAPSMFAAAPMLATGTMLTGRTAPPEISAGTTAPISSVWPITAASAGRRNRRRARRKQGLLVTQINPAHRVNLDDLHSYSVA